MITLKWLKALFKKAEIEEYNIQVDRLFDWFIEQTRDMSEEAKKDLSETLARSHQTRDVLKEKLVLLGEAKLQNKTLPEKVKQIMQGNRETYIRAMTMFLDALEIPREPSQDKINTFLSSFEDRLNQFNKSSSRNFYILKEFFGNELAAIAEQLKKLDEGVRELRHQKLMQIGNIKKKINELDGVRAQKNTASEQFLKEKKGLVVLDNMIVSAEESISKLKASKPYRELEELEKRRDSLKGKIKHHQDVLANAFSSIGRPARKYCHLYPEEKKLFEAYLDQPYESLLTDSELLIVGGLERLRSTLITGRLNLTDREKQKTLLKINELSMQHLRNVLSLINVVKGQLDDVFKQMRLSNVHREIEELEYKLTHLQNKQRIAETKIKKMERKEDKIDPSTVVTELEDDINTLLDSHINIILEADPSDESVEVEEQESAETLEQTEEGSTADKEKDGIKLEA